MNRLRLLLIPIALLLVALGGAIAIFALDSVKPDGPPEVGGSEPAKMQPKLDVQKVVSGLVRPWDVAFLPSGTMLITERGGAISKIANGTKTELLTPSDVTVAGEGGMLGMAIDPDFATNRYVYACFNSNLGTKLDVRVARFTVNEAETQLGTRKDIVTNLPAKAGGRHSGCRMGFGADANLWIGTGDAADESQPQDTTMLGGKILRVDREGRGVAGNITDGDKRVFSYGHRNTQGLALYKKAIDGSYGFSVEHGPDKDDEVNPLVPGNFGWAPGPGYDESASMTDSTRFPTAVKSVWSSGNSTIAVSGADFLLGEKWLNWQGMLAVAVLKDQQVRLFDITDGAVKNEIRLFQKEYGRIRTVRLGIDQSMYFTTDNGNDDAVYRVTPS